MPFRVIVSKRILNRQLIRHFSTQQSQTKIEKIQTDLKQQLDLYINKFNQASDKLKQLTSDVSNSQEALQKASRALNELTGYNHIETVKQKVTRQSELFEATREDVQIAKREYERAIETRSNTQRNINELLQRKHLWTADDVTHFTELYRLEHAHTQAEAMAKERYQSCEKQMDREYMELARSIMERYHEEQLWSDKIRSASTYGTWALMGLNLILFVTVQTVFEPRKRKRLTDRFEELLVAKVDEEEQKWGHAFESLNEKDKVLMEQQVLLMEAVNSLSEHPLFDDVVLQSLRQFETPQIQAPVAQVSDIPVLEISPEMDVQIPDEVIPQETVISNNDNELGNTKRVDQWHSIQSAIAGGLVTAIAIYFLN